MTHTDILINFGIDLIAILTLTGAFYFQRHKRRDLFVIFTFFNIAMFVIVTLITRSNMGIGASFGLFALLGIIRLRSEEFSNYEVGYFFGCLTLAIVNGLGGHHYWVIAILNVAILGSMAVLDSPWLLRGVQHCKVSLDAVYNDDKLIVSDLEKLLNGRVLAFTITRIDNVRDTTNVSVEYQKAKPIKRVAKTA
jgi:hypothetical protein